MTRNGWLNFGFGLLLVALSGCGSAGGGTAEYKTSYVTAQSSTTNLDSDVVTWVDATGTKATACAATSIMSYTPDSIDFTVKSTPYSSTGSTALPLRIDSASITYTPANTSTPAMEPKVEYQTLGIPLANGGTATASVRVVSLEQKSRLANALACNTAIYNYSATVMFKITEIGTGTQKDVPASLQVRLDDFADK